MKRTLNSEFLNKSDFTETNNTGVIEKKILKVTNQKNYRRKKKREGCRQEFFKKLNDSLSFSSSASPFFLSTCDHFSTENHINFVFYDNDDPYKK